MWYKVKRIYQWTNLVRPVWKYSYDFRNKSTTNLTNDWWTLPTWAGCDSNGYYTPAADRIAKLTLPASAQTRLANASKVSLTSQVKTTNDFLHSVYIWKENFNHWFGNYMEYSTVSSSSLFTQQTGVINASNLIVWTWSPSGVITATLTIDFDNLTWNWNCAWNTNNGTITQAIADYSRQNTTIWTKLFDSWSLWARLQKIDLTIV